MVTVQRKYSGACKMNGMNVDVDDGSTANIEVVLTSTQTCELLMDQPPFEHLYYHQFVVCLREADL